MRALVIGGDGLIGQRLVEDLRASGSDVVPTSRRLATLASDSIGLDLGTAEVERIRLPEVDVAFFCAAISRFAACEADPALARRINVEAPATIAERLATRGTHVILLSTAAVFDGQTPKISADQAPSAVTLYGRLKAEAEAAFLALGNRASVLRLTKVLYPGLPLFTRWIEILAAGGSVRAFSDLGLAPITLRWALDALIAIANDRSGGIYQTSARSDISYVDAARHIAQRMAVGEDSVVGVRGTDVGLPLGQAVRFTSLDSSRLDALTGRIAPDPLDVVDSVYLHAIERARSAGITRR